MIIVFFFCLLLTTVRSSTNITPNKTPQKWQNKASKDPTPKPWPDQFHSLMVSNNSKTSELLVIDLWYDWINGLNVNLVQNQLGKKVYNVEHNNGTSYLFTRNHSDQECRTVHFEVGILRPNWLHGANYLGQREIDGFVCNVWEKVEFLWYYEDVVSKRPVGWTFYTGMDVHVMTFEVGSVLEDSEWQAPVYCFNKENQSFAGSDQHSQQMLRNSVPLSAAVV